MTDEDAFLAAICANPADDTARLVFADYLQEQGGRTNVAWALFIRGQVELARSGNACEPTEAARVRVLDVPFWHGQWFARLGFTDSRLTCAGWARGFPLRLSGYAEVVRAAWPRLAARLPFEQLEVKHTSDSDVEDLVTRSGLGRVRELFLTTDYDRQAPLGDRAFVALAGCTAFRALCMLTVNYAGASDTGAAALLDSPHLVNLTSFSARTRFGYRNFVSAELHARLDARFGEHTYY